MTVKIDFEKLGVKFSKDHFKHLFEGSMRDENDNRVQVLFENRGLDLENNYLHQDEVMVWLKALVLDDGLYATDPSTNKNYKFTHYNPAVVVDSIPPDAVVLPMDWKTFIKIYQAE